MKLIKSELTGGDKAAKHTERLSWTRGQIAEATGLCVRSVRNLEARGLLKRINCGLDVALYSDSSVKALFAGEGK